MVWCGMVWHGVVWCGMVVRCTQISQHINIVDTYLVTTDDLLTKFHQHHQHVSFSKNVLPKTSKRLIHGMWCGVVWHVVWCGLACGVALAAPAAAQNLT